MRLLARAFRTRHPALAAVALLAVIAMTLVASACGGEPAPTPPQPPNFIEDYAAEVFLSIGAAGGQADHPCIAASAGAVGYRFTLPGGGGAFWAIEYATADKLGAAWGVSPAETASEPLNVREECLAGTRGEFHARGPLGVYLPPDSSEHLKEAALGALAALDAVEPGAPGARVGAPLSLLDVAHLLNRHGVTWAGTGHVYGSCRPLVRGLGDHTAEELADLGWRIPGHVGLADGRPGLEVGVYVYTTREALLGQRTPTDEGLFVTGDCPADTAEAISVENVVITRGFMSPDHAWEAVVQAVEAYVAEPRG